MHVDYESAAKAAIQSSMRLGEINKLQEIEIMDLKIKIKRLEKLRVNDQKEIKLLKELCDTRLKAQK